VLRPPRVKQCCYAIVVHLIRWHIGLQQVGTRRTFSTALASAGTHFCNVTRASLTCKQRHSMQRIII